MKLKRDFYLQDCVKVARDLLGKVFIHETKEGITKGIIVETEAYNGAIDKACLLYTSDALDLKDQGDLEVQPEQQVFKDLRDLKVFKVRRDLPERPALQVLPA